MEFENNKVEGKEDGGSVDLPGFRFHPTDEELLGFYLKRKVEKRAMSIELIKQADVYKYDPWDLPKSGNVGDKEWYFFCKRGRKYKNSIRPNRVTGSGFWKATGIDKPIYGARDCIGLKKSLVYYRGCAGKGTKTDWMMHEFRLPPADHEKSPEAQEAEVWTLCRIFKRAVSYRKSRLPEWGELSDRRDLTVNRIYDDGGSKSCSTDSSHQLNGYDINFGPPTVTSHENQQAFSGDHLGSPELITSQASSGGELLRQAEYWEGDLRSIVNCVVGGTIDNPFYL